MPFDERSPLGVLLVHGCFAERQHWRDARVGPREDVGPLVTRARREEFGKATLELRPLSLVAARRQPALMLVDGAPR